MQPAGFEIGVEAGETLAEAAWRLGYWWPTSCWGQADCMLCFVRVLSGEPGVVPPAEEELSQMADRLPASARGDTTRLACRLRVTGPGVVVEKKGVRPPGYGGPAR